MASILHVRRTPAKALPRRSPGTLHGRRELMDDLEFAIHHSEGPTVVALYGFQDLAERLESLFEIEGDELIAEITKRFVTAAGPHAVLYEPRRGDFCALFTGKPKKVKRALDRTVREIEKHAASRVGLRVVVGVVELPIEADTADQALALADERRGKGNRKLRAAARQPLSARVSRAIGTAGPEDYKGWQDQAPQSSDQRE